MAEVLGIDVSHHNGKIDWAKVAASGKKFAIMKSQYEAQSHRIDETFEYNYAEAGKNGLARGVYVYIARSSIADPVLDANMLLEKLKGRPLEYGIWLDVEDKNVRNIGKNAWTEVIKLYADIFRKAGYYVGIYCNWDWYKNVLDSKTLAKEFKFWIARYPKNDNGAYKPSSTLRPVGDDIVAWQYSSKGKVPGVSSTNTDLNVDYDGVVNLTFSDKVKEIYDELNGHKEEQKPVAVADKTSHPYKVGQNYKTAVNLFVRQKPNGLKVAFKSLTANGKANGYPAEDGAAVLRLGTTVTCKEVQIVGKSVWIRIPSGWICGISAGGTRYVI